MIQKFVDRFIAKKSDVAAIFSEKHPDEYIDIVRAVVSVIHDPNDGWGESIDPDRIHQIDDGDYQGTLVFVIGAEGYQPDTYWYVKVAYGSCSGCDTLEDIRSYEYDKKPEIGQVEDYMTLALHIVQNLRRMSDERS